MFLGWANTKTPHLKPSLIIYKGALMIFNSDRACCLSGTLVVSLFGSQGQTSWLLRFGRFELLSAYVGKNSGLLVNVLCLFHPSTLVFEFCHLTSCFAHLLIISDVNIMVFPQSLWYLLPVCRSECSGSHVGPVQPVPDGDGGHLHHHVSQ